MKRILLSNLLAWRHETGRKPMILRGARQVGKTHLIRQLGAQFSSYVEVNFEKIPEIANVFEGDLDPKRMIRDLSLSIGQDIIPGETLLFLDEIQEKPRAIIALRYFYEEMPDLHVIAAGSLLDFAIEKVGVPVGRVTFRYLYPMSFIEFLIAYGNTALAREIINHHPSVPINEAVHNKALSLLGEYMAIGGLPNIVSKWIEEKSVKKCQELQYDIKSAYEDDFAKYSKKHQIKYVDLLYQQIPRHICKRFVYSKLETSYRKRELEPALHLLNKARILHVVYHSHGQGIPLNAQAEYDRFKIIMLDVGLTQTILGADIKDWYLNPEVALISKGNLSESFVGQELIAYANPRSSTSLHYWYREAPSSSAEVDYLMASNSKVLPVEVKSGRGSQLKSLRYFLETHAESPYGIRFSTHNYSIYDKLHSYPLYAVAGVVSDKELLLQFVGERLHQ